MRSYNPVLIKRQHPGHRFNSSPARFLFLLYLLMSLAVTFCFCRSWKEANWQWNPKTDRKHFRLELCKMGAPDFRFEISVSLPIERSSPNTYSQSSQSIGVAHRWVGMLYWSLAPSAGAGSCAWKWVVYTLSPGQQWELATTRTTAWGELTTPIVEK